MDFKIKPLGNGWSTAMSGSHVSANVVENLVITCLREGGPLPPSELVRQVMPSLGVSEAQVRDVIWKLIDRGRVDPDDRLRLAIRRAPTH